MKVIEISRLAEMLDYNPESGDFRWRKRISGRSEGSIAGHLSKNGYVFIRLDGELIGAHRIAWALMTGSFSAKEIDHVDCNPSNNSWANLREATPSENRMNTKIRRDNKSGFKGVSWDRLNKKWVARVRCPLTKKYINCGRYDMASEAKIAYDERAKVLHGDFFRSC